MASAVLHTIIGALPKQGPAGGDEESPEKFPARKEAVNILKLLNACD